MTDAIHQHASEIAETKACWDRKPLLRVAYKTFHEEIKKHLVNTPGLTVELGSGIGVIKETIPDCITTDIFENPMVDQVEDAYALSFEDKTIANLILFDVWHHLEYAGSALNEFNRVLSDNGRIILFEPAALSWLGRLVYGCFHHEPIHAAGLPSYFAPDGDDPLHFEYYAAQGNAWKMFYRGELPPSLSQAWSEPSVSFDPAFEWLAAGGFRARQLAPTCMQPILKTLSRLCRPFPNVFATRMMVIIDKAPVKKASAGIL